MDVIKIMKRLIAIRTYILLLLSLFVVVVVVIKTHLVILFFKLVYICLIQLDQIKS